MESSIGEYADLAIRLGTIQKGATVSFSAQAKNPPQKLLTVNVALEGANYEFPITETELSAANIVACVAANHPEVTLNTHVFATMHGLVSILPKK